MSYQFIKIVNTQDGEVAYVLDTDRGVILRMPVEDYGEDMPRRKRKVEPEYEEDTVKLPYHFRKRTQEAEPEEDYIPERKRTQANREVEQDEELPPQRPRAKPASIMPPHLRGVFIRPGKPGADTEHREV